MARLYLTFLLLVSTLVGEIENFDDSWSSTPLAYVPLFGQIDQPPIPEVKEFSFEYRFHQAFGGERSIHIWETAGLAAIVISTEGKPQDEFHQFISSEKLEFRFQRGAPTYAFTFIDPSKLTALKELVFGEAFKEYNGKRYTTHTSDGYGWFIRAQGLEGEAFEVAFSNYFFKSPEDLIDEKVMATIASIILSSTENYRLSQWAEAVDSLPPMRITSDGVLKLYRAVTPSDIPYLKELLANLERNGLTVDLSNVQTISAEVYHEILEFAGEHRIYWIMNDEALEQVTSYGFTYTEERQVPTSVGENPFEPEQASFDDVLELD